MAWVSSMPEVERGSKTMEEALGRASTKEPGFLQE